MGVIMIERRFPRIGVAAALALRAALAAALPPSSIAGESGCVDSSTGTACRRAAQAGVEAFTGLFLPAAHRAAATAVNDTMRIARAAGLANKDFEDDMFRRRELEGAWKPDPLRFKTYLKLAMRVNTGRLKTGNGWRRYPSEEDFDLAAVNACKRIVDFLAKAGDKAKLSSRYTVKRMDDIRNHAMVRLARSMPFDASAGRPPTPPPPGPDEAAYLSAATPKEYLRKEIGPVHSHPKGRD